jgi:excisionase family DNA binding protein
MELKIIDVLEVANILGVSKTHAYKLVNSGTIPSVNVGLPNAKTRRLKVNMQDLEKYIKEGGTQDGTY